MKTYHVYVLASKKDGVLYIGSTSDLIKRIYEHRTGAVPGFTRRYWVKRLVYFEDTNDAYAAVTRERQLKEWKREWKVKLIEDFNPDWRDLYESIL